MKAAFAGITNCRRDGERSQRGKAGLMGGITQAAAASMSALHHAGADAGQHCLPLSLGQALGGCRSVSNAARTGRPPQVTGRMFWFRRKTLVGSYLAFTRAKRS